VKGGARLLRVRNPWGEGEWKGKWSDGSKEWTPEILKQLKYEFAEDGTFWIEFSDFCKEYNRFYILRMFNSEWKPSAIKGEWKGPSAGGCGNFPTWKNNPQFGFTLTSVGDVFVTLMQHDSRMDGSKEPPLNIGFLVLKNSGLWRW
jgi:hypothetical protein